MFAPDGAGDDDGIRPESFAELARVEARHFWFRARNRLLVWAIRKYFGGARSFLEVGCGTGFVLTGLHAAFPRLALAGCELKAAGLAFARTRVPDVCLVQADACRVPFAEEFDVVGAFDVLEHLDDDETALRQIFRATRPGGGTVLTVPQHPALWSVVDERAFHRRRYRPADLLGKMRRTGFRIVRATSFVSVLLPIVWLSRLRQNRAVDDAELHVRRSVNAMLERMLDAERMLIAAGVSLPVGASLLVIARRDA